MYMHMCMYIYIYIYMRVRVQSRTFRAVITPKGPLVIPGVLGLMCRELQGSG